MRCEARGLYDAETFSPVQKQLEAVPSLMPLPFSLTLYVHDRSLQPFVSAGGRVVLTCFPLTP